MINSSGQLLEACMMKSFKRILLASVGCMGILTTLMPFSLAVPPAIITREVGNTRVEVRQLGVVVERQGVNADPEGPSTGWGSSFEEWSGLAYVRFQVRIFRNGRLVGSENVGPITYRGGDLPELVEIKDTDGDRDLEVRVHFRSYTGAARYRVLYDYHYDWRSSHGRYFRTVTLSSYEINPPSVDRAGFI
jgi:hypothetical protein